MARTLRRGRRPRGVSAWLARLLCRWLVPAGEEGGEPWRLSKKAALLCSARRVVPLLGRRGAHSSGRAAAPAVGKLTHTSFTCQAHPARHRSGRGR